MIKEQTTKILTEIIAQNFSYSSVSRKYFDNSKDQSFSKKEEAVESILNKFAREHSDDYNEESGHESELKAHISDLINSICSQKKKKSGKNSVKRNVSGELSSGLSASVEGNPLWEPSANFNRIDKKWCEGLVIDPNNTLYKRNPDGSLRVIQQLCASNMDKCVRSVIKVQDIPEPKDFISGKIASLTALQREIDAHNTSNDPSEVHDAIVSQSERDIGEMLGKDKTGITLRKFLNMDRTEISELKSMDELSSKLVYKFINDEIPASLQFGKMSVVKVFNQFPSEREDGKPIKVFDGFKADTMRNKPITKMAYFENILSECSEYLEQIDMRPKAATSMDDDTPSFGKFNEELYNQDAEKYTELDYESSWLVRTILSPMDQDQMDFTCAWYYAVFNRLQIVISKLHQDGGSTWKTTLKMIFSKALERYYGTNLSFPMARGDLHDVPSRYNDRRQMSLADCMYCPYDEPDQKGQLWEDFKACTGSLTREIMIKILYVNPYMAPTDVLFDIGSNKPIYLTDKGAFLRRIAFIRTTAKDTVSSVPKPIMHEISIVGDELNDRQLNEFHLLMRMGKVAYDKIVAQYGSIEQAAKQMPSIKAELNDNSPWDEYLTAFYQSLFDDNTVELKIANDALDAKLDGYKSIHKTDLGVNHLSLINFIKSAHPENKSMSFRINKQVVRGWCLHKLEVDYTGAEECSFTSIGLDEDGNPIPVAQTNNTVKLFAKTKQPADEPFVDPVFGVM